MNNYYVKNGDGIYINTADDVAYLGMNAFSRSYTDCSCCAEASINSIIGDMSVVERSAGVLDNLTANVTDLKATNSVNTVADSFIEIKDRLFTLEKKLESFEKHENLRNKIDNTIYRSICYEWEKRSVY